MDFEMSEFTPFKNNLIERGASFYVKETNFTKIIEIPTKKGKKRVKFCDEESDNYGFKLMNYAKADALKFLKESKEGKTSYKGFNKESAHIDFFRFYGEDRKIVKGYKVDIVSAYWSLAINEGIISDKTINYFNKNKGNFVSSKKARLKALGSLATTKIEYRYTNGVRDGEVTLNYVKETKELYLWICEKIAEVMKAVASIFNKNIIYYYWDCLFFDDDIDKNKLISICKELGYQVTFETATFLLNRGDYIDEIVEKRSKKRYPIKKNR